MTQLIDNIPNILSIFYKSPSIPYKTNMGKNICQQDGIRWRHNSYSYVNYTGFHNLRSKRDFHTIYIYIYIYRSHHIFFVFCYPPAVRPGTWDRLFQGKLCWYQSSVLARNQTLASGMINMINLWAIITKPPNSVDYAVSLYLYF